MQYKSLAAILFATMALAAPADNKADSGDDIDSDADIPPSILAVVATAVPQTWWAEATNTAAFLSQVEQGMVSDNWPTWYSTLPDSVKEYVTTAVEDHYPSFASSIEARITSTGASDSTSPSTTEATSTEASSSEASSTTEVTSTITDSSSSSSTAPPTGSDAASVSPSASESGAPESSTADGGAAPTGVAMSLAGAAGVLGLALVL